MRTKILGLVLGAALLGAACGGGGAKPTATAIPSVTTAATATPVPPTPTPVPPTPTPVPVGPLTASDPASWSIFLDTLAAAIGRGDVAFLVSRLRAVDGVCTADDLRPAIDQHNCTTVGQAYHDFPMSSGGEGHYSTLANAASFAARLVNNQDKTASDAYGNGGLRAYAVTKDTESSHGVWLTEMFQSGTIPDITEPRRIVVAMSLEFDGRNWRITYIATDINPEAILQDTSPPFTNEPGLRAYP